MFKHDAIIEWVKLTHKNIRHSGKIIEKKMNEERGSIRIGF